MRDLLHNINITNLLAEIIAPGFIQNIVGILKAKNIKLQQVCIRLGFFAEKAFNQLAPFNFICFPVFHLTFAKVGQSKSLIQPCR